MIIGSNKDEGLVFMELLSAKSQHLLPLLETERWEELISYWLFKRKEMVPIEGAPGGEKSVAKLRKVI